MIKGFRIQVNTDGTCKVWGADTGALTLVKAQPFGDDMLLVIKEGGSSYWSGHFTPRSYSPASYHVIKVKEAQSINEDGSREYKIADILVEFPVVKRK